LQEPETLKQLLHTIHLIPCFLNNLIHDDASVSPMIIRNS